MNHQNMFRIVVCCSGGGGNFQALIDAQQPIGFRIEQLIVDRDCGAIDRAVHNNIPITKIDRKDPHKSFSEQFLAVIRADVDLIVLAGFMPIIPADVCAVLGHKMINTHPSLLPAYGGKGMYGVKVQEAVMAAGEEYAGCTVHYVSAEIDGGHIILQQKIKVDPKETPWELGGRVFAEENKLLVEAVKLIKEKNSHVTMD